MNLSRYLRFSLKHVAVVVTLACVGFAWYPNYVRRQRVEQFAKRVLASKGPLNVSFSHADVQVADLARYEDRPAMVAYLFRQLRDPRGQSSDDYIYFRVLGDLIEEPGVVDGLIDVLHNPRRERQKTGAIATLQNATRESMRVVEQLAQCAKDPDANTRLAAYQCLEAMGLDPPQKRALILSTLIAGMRDPSAKIRASIAGYFNYGTAKPEAIPELRRLLNDSDRGVQLTAARSLYHQTGEREPLYAIATKILKADDREFELKKQAASWLNGVGGVPTEAWNALEEYGRYQPVPPFNPSEHTQRYQLGVAARQVMEANSRFPQSN